MTRQARFYQWALGCVDKVKPNERKDYTQKVRSACSLLGTSGAYRTVAFVKAKSEFKTVCDHLDHIPGYSNLEQALRNASVASHIRIRYDLEEALVCLKRAAEAATAGEGEDKAATEEEMEAVQ